MWFVLEKAAFKDFSFSYWCGGASAVGSMVASPLQRIEHLHLRYCCVDNIYIACNQSHGYWFLQMNSWEKTFYVSVVGAELASLYLVMLEFPNSKVTVDWKCFCCVVYSIDHHQVMISFCYAVILCCTSVAIVYYDFKVCRRLCFVIAYWHAVQHVIVYCKDIHVKI